MSKGSQTRQAILDRALDLSSELGLEGLSIGRLAKQVGMSKSGLYAHFESKESLQQQVLDTAAERFVDAVLAPALKQPRGEPRLRTLFNRWLRWESEELSGGCPFIAAAVEYDDRAGPVRDCLVGHLRDLLDSIARTARSGIRAGHLRADLDLDQFAFEYWGILLAHHQFGRLLDSAESEARARRAFDDLIERSLPPPAV